ncbi:hypothetical protein J3R30DRAFT_3685686 [Lentinula aciculospora]|uniref:Uncharacterized protein n=1 Tax=Lentinula aciculospora TaxID=153920 RepID=A0A9W9DJD3_9AGAR|nr:hypothetical protein J3R30DRAFT_3685686 [Lentinula aciculospora]
MRFISLSVSTVFAAIMLISSSTNVAADIIAWSGVDCDGDEGANVACDGSCHSFEGRHSFEVVASGTHCVTFFEGDGCTGEPFLFSGEGGSECIHVDTGTPIGSFSCSANNVCVDRSATSNSTLAARGNTAV